MRTSWYIDTWRTLQHSAAHGAETSGRERDRETETEREREKGRHRDRDTETERERERESLHYKNPAWPGRKRRGTHSTSGHSQRQAGAHTAALTATSRRAGTRCRPGTCGGRRHRPRRRPRRPRPSAPSACATTPETAADSNRLHPIIPASLPSSLHPCIPPSLCLGDDARDDR